MKIFNWFKPKDPKPRTDSEWSSIIDALAPLVKDHEIKFRGVVTGYTGVTTTSWCSTFKQAKKLAKKQADTLYENIATYIIEQKKEGVCK